MQPCQKKDGSLMCHTNRVKQGSLLQAGDAASSDSFSLLNGHCSSLVVSLPILASLRKTEEMNDQEAQKLDPSQEIRDIIKDHKNRPLVQQEPFMPERPVSKPFLKKKDPKAEALAKLGITQMGPLSPSSASPEMSSGSAVLPSPPPPPGKLSSTIKEKQLPLMGLFSRPQTTLSSTSELPPPPPPPPPPVPPPMPPSFPSGDAKEETRVEDSARTMVDDSNIKTQLFSISPSVTFSYANPTWKLFLRKEVFYPKELFSHPYCLNLLCDQIIRDTYSDSCIRLSKEERRKMKDLLAEFQVGMNVRSISEDGIKKRIVLAARDNWANYFSRLFPVKGENGSDIQLLGVSHRGLQLLKRAKVAPFSPEHLKTLCSYSYADVLSLELLGWNVLQLSLKDEQLILHSHKAWQIKAMVEQFLHELKQDSKYVIALRSYVTDDKSLLSFKKGNFIRVLPMEGLEPGWQFGSIGGRSGLFPSALVQFAAVPEHLSLHLNQQEEGRKSLTRGKEETVPGKENSAPSVSSEGTGTSKTTAEPDACHYTMAEFAKEHFRKSQFLLGWKDGSVEQISPALLVQHTKVPIVEPLLPYTDHNLNELATKCFLSMWETIGPKLWGSNGNRTARALGKLWLMPCWLCGRGPESITASMGYGDGHWTPPLLTDDTTSTVKNGSHIFPHMAMSSALGSSDIAPYFTVPVKHHSRD
ncbi:Unconventional myosin-XVB [Varanus komodoensis]|nr:Unconventional myosin-XVB [Varanus komodoensis]